MLEQRLAAVEGQRPAAAGPGIAVFLFRRILRPLAQNNSRNPWLWFFLGLFFNVITVLVLLWKNAADRATPSP